MAAQSWIWKAVVAGACGTLAHSSLMYFKSRAGLLPDFQPYESLQSALGALIGARVPAGVAWAISLLNGATIVGFLFARIYRLLPGGNGATKGVFFGLLGWALIGLLFFPLIGLGPFALGIGQGAAPAAFSLAMLLTYSVVMGMVYAALDR